MRRCWTEDEVTFAGSSGSSIASRCCRGPSSSRCRCGSAATARPAMRRAGRLGDGWIPSFITPDQFRVGVEKTQAFAAEAGREVPADHFGVLFYCCLDPDPAAARALAAPFIPRGRIDDADAGALHRLRSGRARSRAAGGVRRGRRLEVHRAADVPARPDARPARPARQRRHSRPSSALITLGRRLDRRARRSARAQDVDQQPRVDVPAGEDHADARALRNRQAA